MALAALLRPSFNLYSPRQRSANDAFPTSRPNSSGTRQAMQPARINTSSRSGLPRDPEQWTDEDLATCARRHFRPEPTELLLGLIRQFRLTPVALWFLQMDDEELPRLTDGNTELQEQVVDLAIHIRPAVSPTTPRRMNAMQLQAVLDIPEPAPPPPPPPEEPEVIEDDDDDAARSVVSDWALEEQPFDGPEEAVEDAQPPDTHETEHEPFPPPGGALGLDTTGGQQAETPVEAAPEHVEEPEEEAEPEQATEPERPEDLIQFGEDETAEDQSVSISHIEPDNAAETEAAQVGVQDAPAEDVLSSDEEDEHSEHRRAVLVHDESGSQDDFESVEPSQTGAASEDDPAADDDSSATAQPETQAEELVAEIPVKDEEPSAPARELPATTEAPPATAVETLTTPAEELPASTEEPLSIENPAPTEAQPSAGAEEHIAEDSAACPDTTVHEDAQAPQEKTPELEASSDDLTLAPKGSATPQVGTETEVAEEQRQDEEGQRSDSLAVTEDVQTTGEADAALATRSETLEEPALVDDSHPVDVQATAVQDGQHDAEHAESQEQATTLPAETRDQSPPHENASESLSTDDALGELASTQNTLGESQSPAAEPPQVSETPAQSEDTQLTAPEGDAEEETTGAQNSSGATPADDSTPGPDATPEEGDATVQSTTNTETEHVDDGGEDDRTTLPQTTVAPISATASSQSTHTPSESSPSSPIQQQAESEASQPRRAFDMQSPPSLSVSTTPPVSFSMSIANKLSSFGGFGAKSPYSPSALAFSFSNAASGLGRSATPSKEISQLPSPSGIAGPRSASEPVQSPVEREAPPVPTETAGDSTENPTSTPVSEPEARSAVEGDAAEDVANHVEDAMTSSVLQEGGEAPSDHADPVLADAPGSGEPAVEASAETQEEVEGYMVLVSPTTLEKPLLYHGQDTSQEPQKPQEPQEPRETSEDGEGGEGDGSLEPGWHTVGSAHIAQTNVPEGESSAVASPRVGTPAGDQEDGDANNEGGDDDNADADAEGTSGGPSSASKRNKRKKEKKKAKKKGS